MREVAGSSPAATTNFLQCKKLEHWRSGAVEGGDNAVYCSTDLFSIFDSIRILLCINLVSIRALDFGTVDHAKNAVHSSTVLLSVFILACYLHSNILVTNEALNMATMGNTMIAAPFDSPFDKLRARSWPATSSLPPPSPSTNHPFSCSLTVSYMMV